MVCHKLALAIGGMTVGELMQRMTSKELTNWIAYDNEVGIPDANFDHAELCSLLCSLHGAKKKNGSQFGFADFMKGRKPAPSVKLTKAKFAAAWAHRRKKNKEING